MKIVLWVPHTKPPRSGFKRTTAHPSLRPPRILDIRAREEGGREQRKPDADAQRGERLLRGGIEGLQQRGMVRAGDPTAMALSAWSLMHGLVMLTLDGQVTRASEMSPEALAESATNLMMFGMNAGTKAKP